MKVAPPTSVEKIKGRLRLSTIADISATSIDHSGNDVAFLILTPSGDQMEDVHLRKHIRVISGKKGQSDFLNHVLPASITFIREHLYQDRNICVACESGTNLSVGVVVTALQMFFNDDGTLRGSPPAIVAVASSFLFSFYATQ